MRQDICSTATHICRFPAPGNQCQIIDGSSIPTFVIDLTHTVLIWNRACEQVTGKPASEMLGSRQPWRAFYRNERPVMADLLVDHASDSAITAYYGTTWRRSPIIPGALESEDFYPLMDGGIWLFFSAAPLLDANGTIIGAIETLQDITERKRAEAELQQHQANLEMLVRQRTQELEQANEELTQYAFVVSHDLRAPLRAIRNYTGFLREELDRMLTTEQRGYLNGITKSLRHGEALVSDILSFSRVSSMPVTRQPIALDLFFQDLVGEIPCEAGAAVMVSDPMPVVAGEKTILTQIFANLISNGLKFNRSGAPLVTVSARIMDNGRCELAVRDNGIGIEPRYQERIFKMFKRLHTHREFEGTGIGLAIVLKAVTKLNGSVRLESTPGEGSTFYVVLPLAGATMDACAGVGCQGGVP